MGGGVSKGQRELLEVVKRTGGNEEERLADELACFERQAEGVGGFMAFVVRSELELALPCTAHVGGAVPMTEGTVGKRQKRSIVGKSVETLRREYAQDAFIGGGRRLGHDEVGREGCIRVGGSDRNGEVKGKDEALKRYGGGATVGGEGQAERVTLGLETELLLSEIELAPVTDIIGRVLEETAR